MSAGSGGPGGPGQAHCGGSGGAAEPGGGAFGLPRPRTVALVGVVGAVFFGLYFGVPAFFPRLEALVYSPHPPTSQVVAIGVTYQGLIAIGTWLQVTGATLCVVFFFRVAELAGAGGSLAARVLRFGSAVLVSLVLLEALFTLTWVNAAAGGEPASSRAGYDLMSHFIQVFPLVPAPVVYLSLGWILLHGRLLPRWLGQVALGLGIGFVVVGLAEIFLPLAQAFAAGLAGLQDLWILAAALTLARHSSPGAVIQPR